MRRLSIHFVAAVVVCLFASQGHAQTATWATGYPKAGCIAGTAIIQGTATPGCGYSFTGSGTVYYWPQGSGIQQSEPLTVNPMTGNWSGGISGLTSGTTYNIVVEINLQMGMMGTVTVATDPATVTAP